MSEHHLSTYGGPDEVRAGTCCPPTGARSSCTPPTGWSWSASSRCRSTAHRWPRWSRLHPLPTHGGFMDSHVLRKASYRLPAMADVAVLRFNTRGTSSPAGTSEGTFDNGDSERFDVAAAIEYAEFHEDPPLPNRWLVGWSFGTDLALMHGLDPSIVGAILLSPPLRFSRDEHLDAWAASGKPVVALVPELDDYLRPVEAAERFARIPQAEVIGVDGAKHLWVGEPAVRRVLDEIVKRVAPSAYPLPTTVPSG